MAEILAILATAFVFAVATGRAVVKLLSSTPKKEDKRGTWRREQETVDALNFLGGSRIRIFLIREYKGKETGRLLVAEIASSDPDWQGKVQGAIVEADYRRAILEDSEQQ